MNEIKDELRDIIKMFERQLAVQEKNLTVQEKTLDLMIEDKQEAKEKEKTARKKASNTTILLATALVMAGLVMSTMVWAYFRAAYNDNFSVDMKIDNKAKSELHQEYRR